MSPFELSLTSWMLVLILELVTGLLFIRWLGKRSEKRWNAWMAEREQRWKEYDEKRLAEENAIRDEMKQIRTATADISISQLCDDVIGGYKDLIEASAREAKAIVALRETISKNTEYLNEFRYNLHLERNQKRKKRGQTQLPMPRDIWDLKNAKNQPRASTVH